MARRGYIPTDLIIYSRAPDSWHLNAMYGTSGFNTPGGAPLGTVETVKGRKGFAVDKEKDKGERGTAGSWANAKPLTARSRVAMLFDDVEEAWEERPNKPMKNLRVFYLEERAEGGRAYKVIDEDGYVWDMREDVFVEALMAGGIKKGGHLYGEYVFAVNHTQIRLVRVGSALHKELAEAGKRRNQKKLGVRDLKPGNIYKNAGGDLGYFAGFVRVVGDSKKYQLWFEPYSKHHNETEEESILRQLAETSDNYFRWKVKASSSFVEDMGKLPGNWKFDIDAMRTVAQNRVRHYHRDYTGYRYGSRSFSQYLGSNSLPKMACMYWDGSDAVNVPDDISRMMAA